MRIDNITDQLVIFSEEVGTAMQHIQEYFDVSEETALKIVQLGIENMKTEVEHHKQGVLENLVSVLEEFEVDIFKIAEVLQTKEGIKIEGV